MMVLLLSIALLSFLFGKFLDAIVMLFVVVAYVLVEFINKFRSDRTMARLRTFTQKMTKVMRSRKIVEVPTTDIVVGDIVILTEGVRVPADLRLVESFGLLVNEASLTGESLSVQKDEKARVSKNAPLAERRCCVFSGTVVVAGEGKGVVVAVGSESELGRIGKEVQFQRRERTFVQDAMTTLAKNLAVFAIVVSILIPLIGFLRGLQPQEMVLTWLALTFLTVPGQPPVIITMALALASFELSKKKLIVKRLRGVEVLGQVTAIVVDKTGTITENKMHVCHFIQPNGIATEPKKLTREMRQHIHLCLPVYSNDPTDIAVGKSLETSETKRSYDSLKGFGEDHPWREIVYQEQMAIAGQPEEVVEFSSLSRNQKDVLLAAVRKETEQGYRVVAFALQERDGLRKWNFLALAVLSDPVRHGVREAICRLDQAGIDTYLVTGDLATTAHRIAREIALEGELLTGNDLEQLEEDALCEKLKSVRVFARISPSQKQRLVLLLKQKGECVAVIGDGVNDAPAIKAANIGIAMGEIGTDLAKEASDLILTDDNFVHVPDAIAIGRKALDNFRKGLTYYLCAKAILLSIFLVPLAFGIPFPLAPIHIIITELLMDLASSTIFVTEIADQDIMSRPAQKIGNFLNWALACRIAKNGLPLALGVLSIYIWIYYSTTNIVLAQTAAFVSWLLGHILFALNQKQERLPLFKEGITSNRFGFFWLLGMIALSLAITLIPTFHASLQTMTLPWHIWAVIIPVVIATTGWIRTAYWKKV